MPQASTRNIVVVGGGIIGCTTAYYLSRHQSASSSTITLIEASEHGPAQGASGKAGGLVAKWAYPKELVGVSFEEHVKLAEEHNGKDIWGWRYVNCGSWQGRGDPDPLDEKPLATTAGPQKSLEKTIGLEDSADFVSKTGLPSDLLWVKKNLTHYYSPMAGHGGTAQVHPHQFTMSMFELAKANGVNFIKGKVVSVEKANGAVSAVTYIGKNKEDAIAIPATHVVLAAGAWSPNIISQLPISATRAHSITIRPQPSIKIAPYVLFTEIVNPSLNGRRGSTVSPEIYARPDNEIYACGPGDDTELPDTVDEVVVDKASCDSIHRHVASISTELREGTVEKRQACFLPVVSTGGGPLIGEATTIAKNLIIATGHTCWGICNAPGTARAVTELIMDGKIRCANLRKLQPAQHL